jgi:hypothetical protein
VGGEEGSPLGKGPQVPGLTPGARACGPAGTPLSLRLRRSAPCAARRGPQAGAGAGPEHNGRPLGQGSAQAGRSLSQPSGGPLPAASAVYSSSWELASAFSAATAMAWLQKGSRLRGRTRPAARARAWPGSDRVPASPRCQESKWNWAE